VAGDTTPATAPERTADAPPRDVSYAGAFGGLFGVGVFTAIGIAVTIDPGDFSRLWALLFFAIAAAFFPAILVSVVPSGRRRTVQKATVFAGLGAGVVGAYFFGVGFALLMAPPIALLAAASGIIYQGRSTAARK